MEDSGRPRSSGEPLAANADRGAKRAQRSKLNKAALDGLLAQLDSDRDQAGDRYEALRRRLQGLFRWWGADDPLDLTDTTLDRVAMKLDEGAIVSPGALPSYLRGVAHLVFLESLREREQEKQAIRDFPQGVTDTNREGALAALDVCLDSLEPSNRQLVVSYYAVHGSSMIEARRRLASQLNLTPTALRIRVHRIRQRLEECLAASTTGRA